jgi:hypothetical protein
MIPGRKLNFPTTSSPGPSNSQLSGGASAIPSEEEIRAAIAGIQRGFGPAGAVKYFGVARDTRSIHNPYTAQIWMNGKQTHLGCYPTGEAAARAYDAVASTISGRKLNFPNASSAVAAAPKHQPMPAPAFASSPAPPARAKQATRRA